MNKKERAISILTAARKLIARRSGWTKNTYARDQAGWPVAYNDPTACCWCASGALFKSGARFGEGAWEALNNAIRGPAWPAEYNDEPRRTHKQVVAAFDRAIAQLRKAA